MPQTRVVLFREVDGPCPFLNWLEQLPDKAHDKCLARLIRLRALGHELRRPEADLLRDGIYELRIGLAGIHYRILYFFHGHNAAVVSHGLTKRDRVPPAEIDRAIRRMQQYLANPAAHTLELSHE